MMQGSSERIQAGSSELFYLGASETFMLGATENLGGSSDLFFGSSEGRP